MNPFHFVSSLMAPIVTGIVSFYSLSFQSINGDLRTAASYEGKKILIVNTASRSTYAQQYDELRLLQEQHRDSLIIIVFPSNDFGNEPLPADSLKQMFADTTGIITGSIISVTGENSCPVYKWLGDKEQNGRVNSRVKGDFFKYLLDPKGKPVGVFDGSVSPLSEEIQALIR